MNENLLRMRDDLKNCAKSLHELKCKRNKAFKESCYAGKYQQSISDKKFSVRHMHLAYCLAKGKNYSQIESKHRENHDICKSMINGYLKEYDLEAVGNIDG
jgi:hypothetical protein